ncbi:MAG: CAP domain-containing protein [Anaeromyxobacteraceae bacterium]
MIARTAWQATLLALLAACAPVRAPAPVPPPPAGRPAQGATVRPASQPPARGSYGREPGAEASPLEAEAARRCAARARAGGRPATSPALLLAARTLAERAAAGDPAPLDPAAVRAALAGALAYDYAPVAHLVAGEASRAVAAVAERCAAGEATHLGAGAASRDGRTFVVLLLSRRAAALEPVPRDVPVGAAVAIGGELVGLEDASVFATSPAGDTRRAAGTATGHRFRAELRLDAPGRWTVEVVGRGPRGPTVAALLVISCGGAPLAEPARAATPADPADAGEAEAAVLAAIAAARRTRAVAPLAASVALRDVARRHSAAMLAAGVLGHVVRGSGDLASRLRAAGVAYRSAGENVAEGETALAAHRAAEESPAHLANMLAPRLRRAGCGIARGRRPTGEPVVYLTEIFVEPVDDGADERLTPEGRVREALWDERARLGAPPLLSDAALDALARDAARAMARAGRAEAGDALGARALGLGRAVSAADAFVASTPGDAVRSRNLRDPGLRRVGVGVEVGDSDRYGAGRLWIAVVYTD